MENKIDQFLKQHKTGTISKGVHVYNDIRAALVASGVNKNQTSQTQKHYLLQWNASL